MTIEERKEHVKYRLDSTRKTFDAAKIFIDKQINIQ